MAYRDEVLADTPNNFWEFDETSGSSIADAGSGNDPLTVVGANLNVSGPHGLGGASTDGLDDYFDAVEIAAFNTILAGDWTIEAWVKEDGTNAGVMLFDNRDGSSGHGIIEESGRQWKMVDFGDVSSEALVGVGTVDVWQHHVWQRGIDLVNGGANNGVFHYINKVVAAEVVASHDYTNSTNPLNIGRSANSGGESYWKGNIGPIAVYNTILSATRIEAHYDAAVVTNDPANIQATVDGSDVTLTWDASF